MTVDHHVPISAGGDDADDNLVYACARCNLYKGDYAPPVTSASDDHVLHPLNDTLSDHYVESDAGILEPQTPRGQLHVALLRLQPPATGPIPPLTACAGADGNDPRPAAGSY